MINVKINGKAIQVPEGTTILAAAKQANVKIP
ncbi:MAG TPA: 2Fe-2S iron-sulfur cluster-binding protein, partial [Treponemataceae bacterium]|nr:2Fe-2S iron-sulfur cluster-binding protein [Treponemataceae bacterium]